MDIWRIVVLYCQLAQAQENLTYQKPSEEILKLADYTRPPSVMMNSSKNTLVFLYRPTYKKLSDLNVSEMRLAGLRINTVTNISSLMSYINNIKLRSVNSNELKNVVGLPTEPKLAYFTFSPDEQKIAFTHTSNKGVELWLLDV